MTRDNAGAAPSFAAHPDGDGLRVTDPIEGVRFDLHAADPVAPTPAGTAAFPMPVDAAAEVETRRLTVPVRTDVFVRSPDGSLLADAKNGDGVAVPPGEYVLEVGGTPLKLYLVVEGAVAVEPGPESVAVTFDGATPVTVGARSHHQRPAGTVRVTDDPRDAMAALSLLGSALKTTSPERSFPTLRGHPPLIERGERFDAPDGIQAPDTGVRIEVPPEREFVYPVASLAYYLAARVVPGEQPRLVAGDAVHDLSGPDGFEAAVERALKRAFFLDCVVRTEGYYDVDLHERRVVEPRLDLELAALYDRPLADRLAAYLSVPWAAVADQVPAWKLTMDVAAEPAGVEMLPFAARDLAVVRCPSPEPSADTTVRRPPELASFYRGPEERSATTGGGESGPGVVTPAATDSLEHAWHGDGAPRGPSEATVEAYRRRAADRGRGDGPIRVAVVCNDDAMREERLVERLYGDREGLPFEVSVHDDLGTEALEALFAGDADFLHYVGHVDDDGLRCTDGHLDARDLDAVGVRAFALNACRSYDQGRALVGAGSVAGVATLRPVGNEGATRLGRAFARLLNRGFSLRAALSLARTESLLGDDYLVVGDGNATLVEPRSQSPLVYEVEPDGSAFRLTAFAYPTSNFGGLLTPNAGDNRTRYLNAGRIDEFRLTAEELDDYLACEPVPVRTRDGLVWSDEVDAAFFRDRWCRRRR